MSKNSEAILKQFVVLTNFLGQFLGPDYEIVLHDISKEPHSIIAIANGHVSGRKTGGPLTSTALQLLNDRDYETTDYTPNYCGMIGNGRVMRSATMYIKNGDEKVIGLLCMNFDDSRYREWCDKLQGILHPDEWLVDFNRLQQKNDPNGQAPMVLETYYDNIDELMEEIYRDTTSDISIPAENLTQQDRLGIVESLEKRGIFKLKGAVPFVADRLACSQATIYRYLNQIHQTS